MADVLSLKDTIEGLKYIADSPPREYGGFHENAVQAAKSALHYLTRPDPLSDALNSGDGVYRP